MMSLVLVRLWNTMMAKNRLRECFYKSVESNSFILTDQHALGRILRAHHNNESTAATPHGRIFITWFTSHFQSQNGKYIDITVIQIKQAEQPTDQSSNSATYSSTNLRM
jgi:hypothetical protein